MEPGPSALDRNFQFPGHSEPNIQEKGAMHPLKKGAKRHGAGAFSPGLELSVPRPLYAPRFPKWEQALQRLGTSSPKGLIFPQTIRVHELRAGIFCAWGLPVPMTSTSSHAWFP